MNAKAWLNRARTIERELAALKRAKSRMEDELTNATHRMTEDVVQRTKDPHPFDSLGELALTIETRKRELENVKAEILRGINKVQNGLYRTVLIDRYINNMSMESVADCNHISRRNVWRIHGRAILQMEEVLNGNG